MNTLIILPALFVAISALAMFAIPLFVEGDTASSVKKDYAERKLATHKAEDSTVRFMRQYGYRGNKSASELQAILDKYAHMLVEQEDYRKLAKSLNKVR